MSDPEPGKEDPSLPRFQLYDLSKDIGERENVIGKYPRIAGELRDVLKEYVVNGRSTPGSPQPNNGRRVWETVRWLDEPDGEPLKLYKEK